MEYRFPEEPPEGTIIVNNGIYFKKRVGQYWINWLPSFNEWGDFNRTWSDVISSDGGKTVWRDATEDELIEAGIIKPDLVSVGREDLQNIIDLAEQVNLKVQGRVYNSISRVRKALDRD